MGPYYTWMVKKVRKYLSDLGAYLPSIRTGRSYELAGFVWHQVSTAKPMAACICTLFVHRLHASHAQLLIVTMWWLLIKGWNDGCDEKLAKEYGTNMPNFIRDIRKEFADLPQDKTKEKLPFSIGASGMGGYTNPTNLLAQYVIPAQVCGRLSISARPRSDIRQSHNQLGIP